MELAETRAQLFQALMAGDDGAIRQLNAVIPAELRKPFHLPLVIRDEAAVTRLTHA